MKTNSKKREENVKTTFDILNIHHWLLQSRNPKSQDPGVFANDKSWIGSIST